MATPLTYTNPKTGETTTFKDAAEFSRWAAAYAEPNTTTPAATANTTTAANPTIASSTFTPTTYTPTAASNTSINYNTFENASSTAYNDAVARSQQNIYSMATPTMDSVAAPDVNALLNTSYAVQNPYTRGLLERGLAEGQVPWMLTAEGQQAEEQRRIGVLEQATVAPATATMNTALTEVQKQMQKAGKLASSATTTGMMRTSEQYAANIASTMAQGTLSIYDQISQAYNEEANRQLAGATTQAEQETALKTAGVAAEINKYSTQVSAAVSKMQTETEQRVAQISADVTLTGYEKETYIANIQAQTDKQIADIQGQYNMKIQELSNVGEQNVAGMSIASQERIAAVTDKRDRDIAQLNSDTTLSASDKETERTRLNNEAAKEIAALQTESAETIAFGWQNIELSKLAQSIKEFDFTSAESSKQFWATLEEQKSLNKLTAEDKEEMRRLAWAQFEETKSQFSTMTAQQNTEFQANLKLAYDNLASTDADRAGLREIAKDQLAFESTKFWTQDKTQREQFAAQMDFANKELLTNYTMDKMQLEASLQEQAREFDLTEQNDMDQFNENIAWLKDSKQIDVDTEKYLQEALLDSQEMQFWAKMGQDKDFFNRQLDSTESMFWAQIKFDKDKFETAMQQQIKEFDFTSKEDVRQFNENIAELVRNNKADEQLQRDLQSDFLAQELKVANMNDATARKKIYDDFTMFSNQLEQQGTQFATRMEFERTNAAAILKEQARQADLSSDLGWSQLWESAKEYQESRAIAWYQASTAVGQAETENTFRQTEFEFNKELATKTLEIQKTQVASAAMVDQVNAALAFLESPAALGSTDAEAYATGRYVQDLYSGVTNKTFAEYVTEYEGTEATQLAEYTTLAPKVDMVDYNKLSPAVQKNYTPSTVAGGVATLNSAGIEYNKKTSTAGNVLANEPRGEKTSTTTNRNV